jgi:hypothetical protein
MNSILEGSIRISKRLRRNAIWQRKDYGWAWVDLLMLANDRPRIEFLSGMKIELRRGQLAWSVRGLSKEWGTSREWVETFLEFCQDQGMIKLDSNTKRTIITILNYDAYNRQNCATEPATEQATEPTTSPATEAAAGPERNREEGTKKGKGEASPADIVGFPSDSEVEGFCTSFEDQARAITGIPEVWWRGWLAHIVSKTPPPADWKRALRNAFLGDWAAGHPKAMGNLKKNAAPEDFEKNARAASSIAPLTFVEMKKML